MLTRQALRKAKQRLSGGKFPFPAFAGFLRTFLRVYSDCFLQIRSETEIVTNLFGITEMLDLSQFYQRTHTLKEHEDMSKTRIASNVDPDVATKVKAAAEELNLPVSQFIEKAVLAQMGDLDILRENANLHQQLSATKGRVAEHKETCEQLAREKAELTAESDQLRENMTKWETEVEQIASRLGVPISVNEKMYFGESVHKINEKISEVKEECDKQSKTNQALSEKYKTIASCLGVDPVTKHITEGIAKLHASLKNTKTERDGFQAEVQQIASVLGVPDTAQHCVQRIGEIEDNCQSKIDMLLGRSWWHRWLNTLPWT